MLVNLCFGVMVGSVAATTAPDLDKSCGGPQQAPCAVLETSSLCYNVYHKGTENADYYSCYVEQNGCDGHLIEQDGLCQSLFFDRGIECCAPIREDGREIGYRASVDLTTAIPVVPDINVDWCEWNAFDRGNAVRRLSGWMSDPTYASHLAINTNFFEVGEAVPNPHLYMCSTAFGPVIRHESYIAGKDEHAINGTTAWSLVFYTSTHASYLGYPADIFKSSELPGDRIHGIIDNAVTGVLLATKEDGYNEELDSSSFKPYDTVPRTAVGISANKRTLHIAVFQNGEKNEGKTLRELANYMLKHTSSQIVLNFDGSGSSTLYYKDGSGDGPFLTPASDDLPGLSNVTGEKYHRPFPVFLGFR